MGRPVDGGSVLGHVLVALNRAVMELSDGLVDEVLRRWRTLAPSSAGASVEWDTPDGVRAGVTAGLDADGALLVRNGAGMERIISGEVRWL